MLLGEKLLSQENIIYEFAHTRLEQFGLDDTLADVVMGNVYRRFKEAAYNATLLNYLKDGVQHVPAEKKEGTIEDLMEDMKKNDTLPSQKG